MKNIPDLANTPKINIADEQTESLSLGDIFGGIKNKEVPSVDQQDKPVEIPEIENKVVPPQQGNIIYIKHQDGSTDAKEIKGTKLKYFRNGSTDGYGAIRAIPFTELFKIPPGILGKYSGDELVAIFLSAVLDDREYVQKYYDDFDGETVEKIIDIFADINGIKKREEEQAKKEMAQQTAAKG